MSKKNIYYLIEADIRPNSWMAYGRFTGGNFSEGIKSMSSPGQLSTSRNRRKTKEIALFHKDIRRCIYKRDYRGMLRWILNYRYWKYIPFYDFILIKRIIKDIWKEFFIYKIKKIMKRR